MKKHLLLLLGLWLLNACQPTPQPIDYGADACVYCKMSIVDDQHAAELVTEKGKVFTYDAIECMVRALQEQQKTDFAYMLVNDYASPKKLIDAQSSHYLISKNIPSPMGAFLSAFSDEKTARAVQEKKGGELYTWLELQSVLGEPQSANNQ